MLTGQRLLQKSLAEAEQDGNITEAYLHVQSNNSDAMQFYAKRKFDIGETVSNYYRRLSPPDAVVLRRALVPSPSVDLGLPILHS